MNKNISSKLSDLIKIYSIEESNIYIKSLGKQVENYQYLYHILEENKPFSFQRKKMKKYNEKRQEYEKKISDIYLKMNEEVEEIAKLHNEICSTEFNH